MSKRGRRTLRWLPLSALLLVALIVSVKLLSDRARAGNVAPEPQEAR